MSLESKWSETEKNHRHFLASEERNPAFFDWFCVNYSNMFSDSVIQCVRESAGLGEPLPPFYNNRSESIHAQKSVVT